MTRRSPLARAGFLIALLAVSLSVVAIGSADAEKKTAPTPPATPAPIPGTIILKVPLQPVVETGVTTYTGKEAAVSCMTCHTTRPANLDNGTPGHLPTEFHQNLRYKHGEQSCLSCHNAGNYDALRQADGRSISFPNTKQLCAQCHGPQTRDYEHGSHGGMRGYWDLTRGNRTRNTCSDCHDPHAPAYPVMMPIFAPKDRGARQQAERAATTPVHAHE